MSWRFIGEGRLGGCKSRESSAHVDFMIGTDDLNIYGICADGTEVPVFVNGQWAWE